MTQSREQESGTITIEFKSPDLAPDSRIAIGKTFEFALRDKHIKVTPEHLLLGLLADPENEASKFISRKNMGYQSINLMRIFLGPSSKGPVSFEMLKPSPRLEKIIGIALENAKTPSPESKINSVDLLIGIIQEEYKYSISIAALADLGIGKANLAELREIAKRLREKLLKEESSAPAA